jgi:hypothetical protein
MPQNILFAAFVFGAVSLLLAFSNGRYKLFGAEVPRASVRKGQLLASAAGAIFVGVALWLSIRAQAESKSGSQEAAGRSSFGGSTRATQTPTDKSQAEHSTNGGATPPTQTPADKPTDVFPAGDISDNEDSVQILDVSPEPGTYLRRLEPRVFKMKIAYNLKSADVALLSMSIAQNREREGCAGRGHLPDATSVEIKRGRHIVDIDLEWTGDTGAKSKGLIDMKGYLRFVPMFWRSEAGRRGERIRLFEGYERVCMRFGP